MRIAIVNDMTLAAEALRRILATMPNTELAWIARDGAEAVRKCREDLPDLILMDLLMPVMDGPEAIRKIMVSTPCAVLVVTAMQVADNSTQVFEALGAGALDAVQTPVLGTDGHTEGVAALRFKIDSIGRLIAESGARQERRPPHLGNLPHPGQKRRLVAIWASAGGPAALSTILGGLSGDFPAAVIIVQHVDLHFLPQFAMWLDQQSSLPVRIAAAGDQPKQGEALLAGTSDHLVFLDSKFLGYTPEPRESIHRPSVDIFFQSLADHWKGEAVGVILTGMGRDGARGLKAMKDAGFHTIAQDQASCAVYGMPKAAADLGAAQEILPVQEIAQCVAGIFNRP